MKRVLITLVAVAVILAGELIFPIQVSAAPPADGPIVGQLYEIFGMISVYTGPTFDSVRYAINSGTFTVVQTQNFNGVRWTEVIIHSTIVPGVRGNYWVQEGIFSWGLVRTIGGLGGAFVPPGAVESGARVIAATSECQRWRECNGYSRAGSGRVWGWIDRVGNQSGILTTHPEDCAPYTGKPAPPGCYP